MCLPYNLGIQAWQEGGQQQNQNPPPFGGPQDRLRHGDTEKNTEKISCTAEARRRREEFDFDEKFARRSTISRPGQCRDRRAGFEFASEAKKFYAMTTTGRGPWENGVVKEISGSTISPNVPSAIAGWGKLVFSAYQRIRSLVVETPVESICGLVPDSSVRLLAKLENLQKTGSFKLRGATNKISLLTAPQRAEGVIAASKGNPGLGVALAAKEAGVAAQVYVSSHVSPYKASRIEEYGAGICRAGETPLEAELAGRLASGQSGKVFISPYNDVDVIAGQGTIGVELQSQAPALDAVFVAGGGGGPPPRGRAPPT